MVLIGDRYFQGHHEPLVGTDILLLRDGKFPLTRRRLTPSAG